MSDSAVNPHPNLDAAALRQTHAEIEALYLSIGEWTDNTQVRKGGMSLHAKWEHEVDVMTDGIRLRAMFLQAPAGFLQTLDALANMVEAYERLEAENDALRELVWSLYDSYWPIFWNPSLAHEEGHLSTEDVALLEPIIAKRKALEGDYG